MTRPNFLLAGAAKSGTTSLAHYLSQHPDVFMAREKECHFFSFCESGPPDFAGPGDSTEFRPLVIDDAERYRRCFEQVTTQSAVGEASVFYLYDPESLRRALSFNPDMRFLIILREPVGRAFSAFSHHRRDEWEPLDDFRQALRQEPVRRAAGWGYGWHYAAASDYVTQLQVAHSIIPSGQLHIMLYEHLMDRPAQALEDCFAFLGVDPGVEIDTSLTLNASGTPRWRRLNQLLTRQNAAKDLVKHVVPHRVGVRVAQQVRRWNLVPEPLDEGTAARVREELAMDYEQLSQLVGIDATSWRHGGKLP